MSSSEQFVPNWASPPGETVKDLISQKHLTPQDLSELLELSQTETNALLTGHAQVTGAVARRLSACLGASESFWRHREHQYRIDKSRVLRGEQAWLRNLPIRDMIAFGWIEDSSDRQAKIQACKDFFGVSDTPEWRSRYAALLDATAFRISSAFESQMSSVAAWLRMGELLAQSIPCKPWNPRMFELTLDHIRPLTREKNPHVFLPELQSLCAEAGVAVVIVRSPQHCPANGATWFLTRDRAVLQLSFRYLTDDQFWFTLYHEAGHLLLHNDRLSHSNDSQTTQNWILEDITTTDGGNTEREANDFAYHTLIPEETEHTLMSLPPTAREVIRYARDIGISPGIVVGQLQHHNVIRYNQLNRLKRRFEWSGQSTITQRTS